MSDILLGYETDYYGKKASTFDKGADDDGGHTVMSGLLGLAGTGLKGSLTDLTDTESSCECRYSSSYRLSGNSEGNTRLK